jgi:hypothetical protein
MDWLSKYDGVIQCARKAVRSTKKYGATVEFVATVQSDQGSMLNQTKVTTLEDIRVVQKYLDVFPEKLVAMPSDRDIEFLIELLPATPPISKRPYMMPINELVELKKQIAEIQAKGFIRPSSSPWGAAVLFVEKTMELNRCALIINHRMRSPLRISIPFLGLKTCLTR